MGCDRNLRGASGPVEAETEKQSADSGPGARHGGEALSECGRASPEAGTCKTSADLVSASLQAPHIIGRLEPRGIRLRQQSAIVQGECFRRWGGKAANGKHHCIEEGDNEGLRTRDCSTCSCEHGRVETMR